MRKHTIRGYLIALSFLVPAIALGASDGPSPRPAKVQEPPQGHSSEPKPPAKAEQQPANEPPSTVKPIPTNQGQAKSADKPKNGDDKASTDWWMVWLTGVLAAIGFLQLIVFGNQARSLRQTITAMKELGETQSADMQASIRAANKSASAAMSSVKISEETAERQLRAYVYVERAQKVGTDVHITVKNFGQTPAYQVRTMPRHQIIIGGGEPVINWQAITFGGDDIEVELAPEQEVVIPRMAAGGRGSDTFLYGKITYWTAFDKPDDTKFILKRSDDVGDGRLIVWSGHNQSSRQERA